MSKKKFSLKGSFLTGLATLLPIGITIAVLGFLINFLTQPFVGFVTELLSSYKFMEKGFLFLTPEQIVHYISRVLILFLIFLFTLGLGLLTQWFFSNSLIMLADSILQKIPIINTVYKTTKDLLKTLIAPEKRTFQKVVMVPFPRAETYVLGLLVQESPKLCSQALNTSLHTVWVPTAPNPTTGFLMMVKEENMINVDIKPEDAIKYIVSCGVILPRENKKTK